MKRSVLIGATLWLLTISVLHLSLNVGWKEVAHQIKVMLGQERQTLYVGFLPVT